MKLLGPFFLSFFLLFLMACDQQESLDPDYPTSIEELTEPELEQLLKLLENTPLSEYTSIDHFGFPSFRDGTDDSIKNMNSVIEASETELFDRAKQAMLDYGIFLNTSDPSKLQLRSISTINNLPYELFFKQFPDSLPAAWKLSSFQQNYQGMEVRGTSLHFLFSNDGLIALSGHWYHDIYLPDSMAYNETAAIQSLQGKTLSYNNKTLSINETTYWHKARLIILPLRLNKHIELRQCWALYPENWEVLIDTQTGEKLSETIIGIN